MINRQYPMLEIVESNYTRDGHGEIILDLLNGYAADLVGGGEPLSEDVRRNLIGELEKRDQVHTIIAFVDGTPAGLAITIESFSTFACRPLLNIHDLYVSPPFRGRGIAKSILGKAEEIAQKIGCCKLTLEVLENNVIAQHLYRVVGFKSYELDPKYGRALFLEKKL